MKTMYEAVVTSHGGRNGHVRSSDGLIDFDVSMPKSLGGTGAATNPEQLFAAGYAACFENAVLHIARMKKIAVGATQVVATVSLSAGPTGAFQLGAKLATKIDGVSRDQAQMLVEEAHKICPYSNATRGNIAVEISLA
jgi:osmotically inducible protein OsmC